MPRIRNADREVWNPTQLAYDFNPAHTTPRVPMGMNETIDACITEAARAIVRAGSWIKWEGTPLHAPHFPPGVTDATPVEVIFRNGQVHKGCGQSFGWYHRGSHPEVHVIAYRILG